MKAKIPRLVFDLCVAGLTGAGDNQSTGINERVESLLIAMRAM